MAGSWCQGLVVLSENITLRMNFSFFFFFLEHWPLGCVLSWWRIGTICGERMHPLRLMRKSWAQRRGGWAENNMSNFINGRERLWLPEMSVKDRGREWWGGGDGEGRGRQGERWREARGSVTQSVKERGEEGLGLVVNGYNWLREAGAKWERERLKRWKDEEGRFPTSWVSTSITLSLSLPSSISVSYQPQCGILSHQIS